MSQCDGYLIKFNGLWSLASIGFAFSVTAPDGVGIVRCERDAERRWREYRLCLPHYRMVKDSAAPTILKEEEDYVVGEVLACGVDEPEDD